MTIIITLIMGLITGAMSGLFGIGGGVVMTPMLVLILGVAQHTAQGISLLMMIPTALVGLWHYHKDNLVDYRMAAYLAAGAVCGALISANFVRYIPAAELKKLFGIFIIYNGIRIIMAKPKK